METLTTKKFIDETDKVIATLRSTKDAIVLTHKNMPAIVVQSLEEYIKHLKAYLFLKLMAEGEDDIKSGNVIPQHKVFNDLKKNLHCKYAYV